jgi:inner membrane protein
MSTAYLCFTVYNHESVLNEFRKSATASNLVYSEVFASPTPLNNILWFGFAEVNKGYHLGMYSVFDKRENIEFTYYPRNEYLLDAVEDQRIVETLKWFSDNKYVVTKKGDTIIFHDIRFGKAGDVAKPAEETFVFNFHIWKDASGQWMVDEVIGSESIGQTGSIFDLIYERAKGI